MSEQVYTISSDAVEKMFSGTRIGEFASAFEQGILKAVSLTSRDMR
jgi:hypothetical protein